MNRQKIDSILDSINNKEILLELITGYGKTKLALDYSVNKKPNNILIVIPKLVLIDSWKKEIIKWKYNEYLDKVEFTTYISLHKYCDKQYDVIIFDECHHISDRCKEILPNIKSKYKLFLSATISLSLKWWLKDTYPDIYSIKTTIKDAVDNKVLPDPKLILIPLHLDYKDNTEVLVKKNKTNKTFVECEYKDRWQYLRTNSVKIKCTPYQYYNELSSEIEFWKKKAFYQEFAKNKWLSLCGERLKWLSNQKNSIIIELLTKLKDNRVLTFCSTIKQATLLGSNCINSENVNNDSILNNFNTDKIKHITAVNMLDEGININDCQIGLFANINSSERLTVQRIGRILRHNEPIIIFPYYKNTREEEIVNKIIESYNPELIKKVELNNFKLL